MVVRFGVDPTGALQQQGAQNPATQSGSRVAGDDLQAGQGAGRHRITTLAAAGRGHGSGFFAGQDRSGARRRATAAAHPQDGWPKKPTGAPTHCIPYSPTARILDGGDCPHSHAHNRHASTSPHNRRKRAGERGRASGVRTAMLCGNRHVLPSPPPAAGLAERAPGGLGRRAARPRGAGRGGSRSVSRGCPPCPPPPS